MHIRDVWMYYCVGSLGSLHYVLYVEGSTSQVVFPCAGGFLAQVPWSSHWLN